MEQNRKSKYRPTYICSVRGIFVVCLLACFCFVLFFNKITKVVWGEKIYLRSDNEQLGINVGINELWSLLHIVYKNQLQMDQQPKNKLKL